MARGERSKRGHQIITSLFGVPRRLDHYLITLGVCEADLRKCQPTISTALEEILEKLLVCPQSCPTLPVESSTPSFSSHVSSQHEVVANTIKVLCQRGSTTTHVLSQGYRLSFGKANKGVLSGTTALENIFPNSLCNQLRGNAWQALLQNIGDERMTFLLMSCAMFQPLSNGCYLQISGCPAHVRVKENPRLVPCDVSSVILSSSAVASSASESSAEHSATPESGSVQRGSQQSSISSTTTSHPSHMSSTFSTGIKSSSSFLTSSNSSPWWMSSSDSTAAESSCQTDSQDDKSSLSDSETSYYMLAPPVYGEAARRWHFHRNRMFYATSHQETLPPKYILYQLPASRRGAEILLRLIFDSRKPAIGEMLKSKKSPRLPRHLLRLLPLFRKLLEKFKKVKLLFLLRECCALPDSVQRAVASRRRGANSEISKEILLSVYTAPHQVVRFLRAVLKHGVPKELWGSMENFDVFMSHIDQFVHLQRLDTYSVHQMMEKFKASHCTWLYPTSAGSHPSTELSEMRRRLLQTWIYWLVDNVVVTLVKTCFFVTDTSCHRNKLFYYRKSVWRCIHHQSQTAFSGKLFDRLSHAEVCDLLQSRGALGVSMLRMLPKSGGGIRPIINLAYKPSLGFLNHLSGCETAPVVYSSVNAQLNSSFNVLRYEQMETPDFFGSSVYCVEDIHKNWRSFIIRRRANNDNRPLFFAALDIKGCFDNINQDLLLEIIGEFLASDSYFVRRFTSVLCGRDSLAHANYKRCACPGDEFGSSFKSFMDSYLAKHSLHDALLTDQVIYPKVTREGLIATVEKHIKNNLIRVGHIMCRQCTGVAQGSILSSLLCCLYYGYLERDLLSRADKSGGLLQRFVDDYLLVTPCQGTAEKVVSKMYKGWPQHGSVINWKKTLVNFDVQLNVSELKSELLPRASSDIFPWCGFLFNTKTLQVSVDYSRWFGQYLSDSLTINYAGHTLQSAKSSLQMTLKTKCNAMLLDSTINHDSRVVVRNVYQAFFFVSLKLHSLSRRLPQGHSLRQSFKLMKRLLSDLVNGYYKQGKKQCEAVALPGDGGCGGFQMSHGQVSSIAHCAFYHMMSRHFSAYDKNLVYYCQHRAGAQLDRIDASWKADMELILL